MSNVGFFDWNSVGLVADVRGKSHVNGEILAAVEQGARSDRPKPRTNNPERTKLDISNAAMDEFA